MLSLFEQLLTINSKLIKLLSQAERHLTVETINKGGLSTVTQERWHKFLINQQNSHQKLVNILENEPINMDQLDIELNTLRQVARYFDEVSCEWSTNYTDISKYISKMTYTIYDIDCKFQLGSEKW